MRACYTLGLLLLSGSPALSAQPQVPGPDPLDPLSAEEITVAREAIQHAGRLSPELRFAWLTLREPPKTAVLVHRRSGTRARSAEAILYDWATSTPIRAWIDLQRRRLILWDTLPSREPPTRALIGRRLDEIVRSDPRWAPLLAQRGIADPAEVRILPQLPESAALPWEDGRRVIRAFGFHQEAWGGKELLRGIRIRVDLTRGKVLELADPSPPPPDTAPRSPASPAHSVTKGATTAAYLRSGSSIRWKSWELRFGMHQRRGLELWDIAWTEGGLRRGILYRASISEVLAAYGDPEFPAWYPRDAGNEGLGVGEANSAVEEADGPPGAEYVDADIPDTRGYPRRMPRAITIYERDGGVLWRHAGVSRRARQLVISSHTTIDNYDFIFNWILGEDGAIDVEVQLTGLMLIYRAPADTAPAAAHASAHRVGRDWMAPIHQHFFSYRLDFDLDGDATQRLVEVDTRALPRYRSTNVRGLGFAMEERTLESERAAIRPADPTAARFWKVVPGSRAGGYALLPGAVAMPFAARNSPLGRQIGFAFAQLFATPWQRDEMYAAGEFQNFGAVGEGLPGWTGADRTLIEQDLVLWHTVGITHLPRPEEFPVMPVARAGFRLVPMGFFSRNPALGAERAPPRN